MKDNAHGVGPTGQMPDMPLSTPTVVYPEPTWARNYITLPAHCTSWSRHSRLSRPIAVLRR